ncbi:DUF3221 domain-containing protein [Sutcliffiella rhizosphaerae]|uniref:DUF3221 domain-containing protein n=1 Tax=Sutcliffiella rhizosphaerae TaxID=2880967 RepID=A0ABM8YTN4_9BACI|nr:DUF3221 domain-containing protein [Sutcliffiella rhizosphaerae]CAG9623326.1 hypothetical protein BACCIP111883_04127 [Sutcliffiella rhizosphaerae]
MNKSNIRRSLVKLGVVFIILSGIWVISELSIYYSTKEKAPTDVGYAVFHYGTLYFVKGDDITVSDLESFSDEDVMFSGKFDEVSILMDGGVKTIGKRIKSGDRVAIWYEEVLESYPAQIKLIKIEKYK